MSGLPNSIKATIKVTTVARVTLIAHSDTIVSYLKRGVFRLDVSLASDKTKRRILNPDRLLLYTILTARRNDRRKSREPL